MRKYIKETRPNLPLVLARSGVLRPIELSQAVTRDESLGRSGNFKKFDRLTRGLSMPAEAGEEVEGRAWKSDALEDRKGV